MSLKSQIQQDLTQAIKSKDTIKTGALRMLKAAIMKFEVSGPKKEATDEDIINIIQKEVKQRKDSQEQFEKGGRKEMAEKEKQEAEVLATYLPEQMSEDELKNIVQETIQNIGATSKADIGKVMGAIMPKIKGRADGKTINKLVMEALS